MPEKGNKSKYAPLAGGQRKRPDLLPTRYVLSVYLFCGFFMLYALRVNLSVAIVAMVNGTVANNSNGGECPALDGSIYNVTSDMENGEFQWDENTQGLILGSFFYGYVLSQVPGGRLAELLGAKWLLGGGIMLTSLLTLLTPVAAYWGPSALMALRVLEGCCEGVMFPSTMALLSHWCPRHERSRMISFNVVGTSLGTVITLPLTGQLCSNPIFGGWPTVFYLFGSLGCLWSLAWALFVYECPELHPRISKKELHYIQRHRDNSHVASAQVPWRLLLSSRAVWSLGVTMFCANWGFYLLLIDLPNYLKSVLHYPLNSNGYQNGMIHMACALSTLLCAPAADLLRKYKVFAVTTIRKIFQTIGPALCLGCVPLMGCSHHLTITLLILGMSLYAFTIGGQSPVALDIAPHFAGTVMGITNGMGNMAGMLAPLVTGYFTEHNESLGQWKKIFFLASTIYMLGAVVFVLFGSAKQEEWGALPHVDTFQEPFASSE
ncbi:sialin-like isoform X2 [Ornithodoros turicata]|uniref:sialin-like isoform X2 n=1 Tax=Ornithodoros turicata TaxID=34597 RepID=UPI00313A3C64